MSVMLIANNCTRESGSFMGDQLCALKACYLFVENTPNVDKVIMSVSPGNEMHFLWTKFINKYNVELVYDDWNPGDWTARFAAWDKWRTERKIEGRRFDFYRELYLRIHGAQRQGVLCGSERGLGRRNIYEYWYFGQENLPTECKGTDWYDDTLIDHPPHIPTRDVYISPHCKTQGNITFTFDYWAQVVHRLLDAGVTVTVGYDGFFCEHFNGHPLYKKHWGDHKQWMEQVCSHKIIACGNTGTGWLAAACGVPLFTMEPPNSVMADHRYRECGLKNIVEVMDVPDPDYCARRLIEELNRTIVMTTGCYDVLHAGHIQHLERSRALGTKLIVALNSDNSVATLKGRNRPINPQNQRKAVLEALRCVNEVRIFEGCNAIDLIEEIRPQVLTTGYGYTIDQIVGRELVEGYGGRVVVTCIDDATNDLSTTKIVKRMRSGDIIELCRIAQTASVNPFDKLKLLADTFLKVVDIPGDVADLGAYQGGTSLILRRLAPDKHLHIFDTWCGTPYDDELCHHKGGEWSASIDICKQFVGTGELTHYWQGTFPLHYQRDGLGNKKFCFAYIDPDVYLSVKDAIEWFWPRMSQGGIMMFDDYSWSPCAGVKKAVDEVFTSDQQQVIQSQYTCIVVKK